MSDNLPQNHDLNDLDHNEFFISYGYPINPPSVPTKVADPNPGGAIPNYNVPGGQPPSGNPDKPDGTSGNQKYPTLPANDGDDDDVPNAGPLSGPVNDDDGDHEYR
jgi:hypothetical protein